tara:strand:- start:10600 stop:11010 length:411 start_codon:yes stop_codon:yes gene_type:complete
MATIYLPVEATDTLTSQERATAINAEIWHMRKPAQYISAQDVTRYYFSTVTHPSTSQVAVVGGSDDALRVHPEADITALLALLPEITESERTSLTNLIEANKGGTVTFSDIIPTTSVQLTEAEADAAGWTQTDEIE